MSRIAGSTILITGAASGIGRLLTLKTAALGARVVLWDIDSARLTGVVEEVGKLNLAAPRSYVCDVSNREAVYATARQVLEDAGPIDILVNNAGVISGQSLLECSDEQIERTLGVNTMALFWTCRAFLPGMIRSGKGHVVTVASAAGLLGVARLVDYCASKFAAVGFDEALRMEFRQLAPQLKTTVVCPYLIDTGFVDGVVVRFPWLVPILKPEAVAQRIVQAIARNRRRVMMPWLVRFLAPLHLLPVGIIDWLVDWFGINQSMETFRGRTTFPPSSLPSVQAAAEKGDKVMGT